jgi:hypothetical protein
VAVAPLRTTLVEVLRELEALRDLLHRK